MALVGRKLEVAELDAHQRDHMFQLLDRYYNNVVREQFDQDLAEKNWVILMTDSDSGEIKGFSTQMLFEHRYQGEDLQVVFSGDTIIDPAHWGSLTLPITFGNMMLDIHAENPGKKLFWMLISKGFRTYRFLPVFFREFFPRHDIPIDKWSQGLIHELGKRKFPDRYHPASGIVQAKVDSQSLKSELAEISNERREKNKHIDFFMARNPGAQRGDELVCLLPFYPANIKPFIMRELKKVRS